MDDRLAALRVEVADGISQIVDRQRQEEAVATRNLIERLLGMDDPAAQDFLDYFWERLQDRTPLIAHIDAYHQRFAAMDKAAPAIRPAKQEAGRALIAAILQEDDPSAQAFLVDGLKYEGWTLAPSLLQVMADYRQEIDRIRDRVFQAINQTVTSIVLNQRALNAGEKDELLSSLQIEHLANPSILLQLHLQSNPNTVEVLQRWAKDHGYAPSNGYADPRGADLYSCIERMYDKWSFVERCWQDPALQPILIETYVQVALGMERARPQSGFFRAVGILEMRPGLQPLARAVQAEAARRRKR